MLATGGSAVDAVKMLKKRGCKKIKALFVIAAPQGVEKLAEYLVKEVQDVYRL